MLNVDGSSLGNPGPAGFGGVVRNEHGGWCFGYSCSIGVSELLKAELLALLAGLQLCWSRGFRRVVVHSDSRLALGLLRGEHQRFHVYNVHHLLDSEVYSAGVDGDVGPYIVGRESCGKFSSQGGCSRGYPVGGS